MRPASGRFLSEDPIGLSGGVNPTVFAGGDPVNGVDPHGTCDIIVQYYTEHYLGKVYQGETIEYEECIDLGGGGNGPGGPGPVLPPCWKQVVGNAVKEAFPGFDVNILSASFDLPNWWASDGYTPFNEIHLKAATWSTVSSVQLGLLLHESIHAAYGQLYGPPLHLLMWAGSFVAPGPSEEAIARKAQRKFQNELNRTFPPSGDACAAKP